MFYFSDKTWRTMRKLGIPWSTQDEASAAIDAAVGPRPSPYHFLIRARSYEPWSASNVVWVTAPEHWERMRRGQ